MDTLLYSKEALYVVLRILSILVFTIIVARIFAALTKARWRDKLHFRQLYNILHTLIYVVGAFFIFGQIPGVHASFEALLAGSGILALAVSLGAQESLGNFINGIVLSASKPFEVGNRIHLIGGNITGYVEDITMRHVVVRTFANSRIIIPNSVINKDMIENANYLENQAAGFVDVIITLDSDAEHAIEIMAKVVGDHPNTVDTRTEPTEDKPKVNVFVRALSVYGIELRTTVWTESIDLNFVTCSEIRRDLKLAFEAAGVKLAQAHTVAAPSLPI